jgi:hypothetical protein
MLLNLCQVVMELHCEHICRLAPLRRNLVVCVVSRTQTVFRHHRKRPENLSWRTISLEQNAFTKTWCTRKMQMYMYKLPTLFIWGHMLMVMALQNAHSTYYLSKITCRKEMVTLLLHMLSLLGRRSDRSSPAMNLYSVSGKASPGRSSYTSARTNDPSIREVDRKSGGFLSVKCVSKRRCINQRPMSLNLQS